MFALVFACFYIGMKYRCVNACMLNNQACNYVIFHSRAWIFTDSKMLAEVHMLLHWLPSMTVAIGTRKSVKNSIQTVRPYTHSRVSSTYI